MKYKIIAYVLLSVTLALAILSACNPESESGFKPHNGCMPLEELDRGGIQPTIERLRNNGHELQFPTYSPDDITQMAFVQDFRELLVLNTSSGQISHDFTMEMDITTKPSWGTNGLICFSTIGSGQVHFLNLNTGSIESVLLGHVLNVSWISDTQIGYSVKSSIDEHGWCYVKYDPSTRLTDTIIKNDNLFSMYGRYTNSEQRHFLYFDLADGKMVYLDIDARSIDSIEYSGQTGEATFAVFHPVINRVYWLNSSRGLYYYDYSENNEVRIKRNCASSFARSFDIDPSGEKIVIQFREKWRDKAPDEWLEYHDYWHYVKDYILELNLDGSEERTIRDGSL